MPDDDRRSIIPSPVDPEVECVPIEEAQTAQPPPGPAPPGPRDRPSPCPEGYVPRRKRREYELEGKRILGQGPPTRNPTDTSGGKGPEPNQKQGADPGTPFGSC